MPDRVRTLIAKLIRLRRAEWRDLLRAQAAVLAAHVRVWTLPQGRLVARRATGSSPVVTESAPAGRAEALARAIHRVSRYGLTRPRCLVRAIALRRLLAAHGLDAVVRVGVRQHDGKFHAHAWVEHGGTVLGDYAAHTGSFTELSELHIAEKG